MLRPVADEARGVVSVHDAILALIPAIMLAAAVVGAALSWSWGMAMVVGGLPASGTIGYALFYNPPSGVDE